MAKPDQDLKDLLKLVVTTMQKNHEGTTSLLKTQNSLMQQIIDTNTKQNSNEKTLLEKHAKYVSAKMEENTEKLIKSLRNLTVNTPPNPGKRSAESTFTTLRKRTLHDRKHAYIKLHRCTEILSVYQNHLSSNPLRIPKKMLPKTFENEDPEEFQNTKIWA